MTDTQEREAFYNEFTTSSKVAIADYWLARMAAQREEMAKAIESATFRMDVKEYLPKVKNWNKTSYDDPFDDGFSEAKKVAAQIVRSAGEEVEG